ncbi:MAG: twin-arginine translocase subunit TatC [Propionibacteriaceae bacterium]
MLDRLRRINLSWLKPPPAPVDGNMTLFEHLRELRYRLVLAVLAILVGSIICAFFYQTLFTILERPYNAGIEMIRADGRDIEARTVINGVASPFTLAFKVSLIAGLVLTAPVWLYQVWSFIVPGLLSKEKKWSMIFIGCATPLFLAGIALGYFVMPKGIAVMINFTPENSAILNLVDVNYFLGFMIRVMLVFGVSFLLPLVVVMLNLIGVVKARQLSKARNYVIIGCFVFGAVATPSVDPISMLLLAIPMTVLFVVAELIAYGVDARRARKANESGEDIVLPSGKTVSPDADASEIDPESDAATEEPVASAVAEPRGRSTMAESLGLKPTSRGDADHSGD